MLFRSDDTESSRLADVTPKEQCEACAKFLEEVLRRSIASDRRRLASSSGRERDLAEPPDMVAIAKLNKVLNTRTMSTLFIFPAIAEKQ